jgi:hypothetical protein
MLWQVEDEVKYTTIKSKEKEENAAAKTASPSTKPSGHDVRFVRVGDNATLTFSVEDACNYFLALTRYRDPLP